MSDSRQVFFFFVISLMQPRNEKLKICAWITFNNMDLLSKPCKWKSDYQRYMNYDFYFVTSALGSYKAQKEGWLKYEPSFSLKDSALGGLFLLSSFFHFFLKCLKKCNTFTVRKKDKKFSEGLVFSMAKPVPDWVCVWITLRSPCK